MALVDDANFYGIIHIDTSRPEIVENIAFYANYCEEKYLKLLLGEAEYYQYTINSTIDPYKSLVEKASFTYGNVEYLNDIPQMLTYFTYFEYTKDQSGFNSSMGEMSANIDNSTSAMPMVKLVRAYNLGVNLYKIAQKYVETKDFENIDTSELKEANSFEI